MITHNKFKYLGKLGKTVMNIDRLVTAEILLPFLQMGKIAATCHSCWVKNRYKIYPEQVQK